MYDSCKLNISPSSYVFVSREEMKMNPFPNLFIYARKTNEMEMYISRMRKFGFPVTN